MPLPSFSKSMWLAAAVLGVSLASCRGDLSAKPPVHLVLDMDFQPKLRAQDDAQFAGWADGRSMRAPVADPSGRTLVVARDTLGDAKLSPRTANNAFVTQNPLPVSADVLARGRYLFDINCAVCHGYSGMGGNHPEVGHGMVGRRWPVAIPNFHFVQGADNRVPQMPDGEYFEVITFGKGTMPAYGPRIRVEDRWAIVHYVRALQQLSK